MSKTNEKNKINNLLEEAGLNSFYKNNIKRLDRGLLGGNKPSDILSRETFSEAEKAFLDPQVSTCFLLNVFSIMKKDISFESITEGKKRDINKSKEMANFLNFSIKKLKNGGIRQLEFDLLTAKFFGFSLVEKVYDVLDFSQSSKYANFYYYKSLKCKRSGLWDFHYDDKDNVIGFKSLLQKDKVWTLSKFMSLSYLPTFNNPNGNGDFDRIWKFWDAKREFIIFLVTLGSRLSKGRQIFLKGANNGAYDENEIKGILEDLSNNLSVYVPYGYEIDFANFDIGALQHFQSILRWLDSQIAIAMIGSSLSVNESQGAGTNAQSQVHMQNTITFEDYLEGLLCDCLEEQYAYDLLKLNFDNSLYPEELYPSVKMILPKNESDLEKISVYEKLKGLGVLDTDTEIDLNMLREEFNLPENPDLFIKLEELQQERENQDNQNDLSNNEVEQQDESTSSFYGK